MTPIVAQRADDGSARFTPVSVVDVHAALLAHAWAHEFGHQLGLLHEGQRNAFASSARPWPGTGNRCDAYSLMCAGHRRERGRRLEWSRADDARWGNADHDEAGWLRNALPQLAQQRFRCRGVCGGTCSDRATPAPLDASAAA